MAAPSQLVHTAIRFPSGHAHHQTIHLNLTEQPEAPPEPQKAYLPPLVGPPVKTLLPDASFRTPENEIGNSDNELFVDQLQSLHAPLLCVFLTSQHSANFLTLFFLYSIQTSFVDKISTDSCISFIEWHSFANNFYPFSWVLKFSPRWILRQLPWSIPTTTRFEFC